MSDHAEKTHPVSGAIFALVLSLIVLMLVSALAGGTDKALFALPFILLASFYGVFALGADKGGHAEHAHGHDH